MPVSSDFSFLPPDMPDRSILLAPAIRDTLAIRKIAKRSKGSKIGGLVCPATFRLIRTESEIEHAATQHCYADRAVATVREQAARIVGQTPEGDKFTHILDLVAITFKGLKLGLVVKHSSKAAKMRLCDFVATLAPWTPKRVADRVLPLTNRDLPEFHVRNAQHFLSVRRDQRNVFDDLVREAAPLVVEPTTIREFTAQFGGGEFAFRPVLRAIFFGTFVRLEDGLIDADTEIQFSGSVEPDLDQDRRYPMPGKAH